MRMIAATFALLVLAACTHTPPKTVPAQCNPICFLPCAKDGDPGVRWEADPNSSDAWDELAGEVVPALVDKNATCELRRSACEQCLRRLDKAKVIEL